MVGVKRSQSLVNQVLSTLWSFDRGLNNHCVANIFSYTVGDGLGPVSHRITDVVDGDGCSVSCQCRRYRCADAVFSARASNNGYLSIKREAVGRHVECIRVYVKLSDCQKLNCCRLRLYLYVRAHHLKTLISLDPINLRQSGYHLFLI